MKYELGKELFYVCPFVFTIEKVILELYDGNNCYIESTGAYLKEECLFQTLEEAKNDARIRLHKFYHRKAQEINRSNPIRMED